MGSVIDNITCPNCNYEEATEDFYYKSDETYIFCKRCGYFYGRTLKDTDDLQELVAEKIRKDKGEEEGEEEEYSNNFEIKEGGELGSFSILFGGCGTKGSFTKEYHIKDFENEFKKGMVNQKGKKADGVCYTFKQNGKWYVKDLIKNKVCLFEEFEDE